MSCEQKKILVTGGSGLVGSALFELVKKEKFENEEFIFISSNDCDLMFVIFFKHIFSIKI